MKVFVTGCCGFIGYHIALKLLKNKVNVIGIDNINNYYSIKIKKGRLSKLKKFKLFSFHKLDISNKIKTANLFKKYKPNKVIHFAAQAGVAYSKINPDRYIDSNIVGFYNILINSKKFKVDKIIYASSSSVYGDSKILPVKENFKLQPKNIYGLSKKINEEMAELYSKELNLNLVGLRFFSIYGEFGRPDMLIYKLLICKNNKKTFYLNNYGNHYRDFTYISDVVEIINKILKKNNIKKHEIVNICNNKPVKITNILEYLKINSQIPKIQNRSFQEGDIFRTFGSNKKIKNITGKNKFINFSEGLKKTVEWFNANSSFYI